MLTLVEAVALIQQAQQNPILGLWGDYDISKIPFAVYDDNEVVYLNHPNPPQDRPPNLVAATSTDINGTQTATMPVQIVGKDVESFVPIAYHEGFHVYQHHHFKRTQADFFMALSHYPDLDPDYRALCQLENDVLAGALSHDQKLAFMATLGRMRRERLSHHDSLLGYERLMERSEGTASYIEQKARQKLFGIEPKLGEVGHGWSRFYQIGAGLCWLLDEHTPNWMARVEAGESLGDITLSLSQVTSDLSEIGYDRARQIQQEACATLQNEVNMQIDALQANGTLRIAYQGVKQVYRAFTPITMVSLGDGRVLHRSMFQLIMPKYGKISCDNVVVIDNIAHQEIIIGNLPVTYADGDLHIDSPHIQAQLSGVVMNAETCFAIHEPA
jgi:hypothetical protein